MRPVTTSEVAKMTVCHIQMISSSHPHEKLSIRVERGTRPRLKCSDDGKKVQITVPLDTQQNWPPVKAELFGGYTVLLQRLQQQFKITVQHAHERKPEFVVYSSSLAHEKEVRTQVREVNTQLAEVGIAGPNLDAHGNLKARRLTLESTVGTMHVYAKLEAEKIRLHSQNIVIASEALVGANKIKMVARRIQIDGRIFPLEAGPVDEPKVMSVMMDAFLLHIGVDGRIGEGNEKENMRGGKKSQMAQVVADGLLLQVSGSLANYGKIVANEKVDLVVGGSVLSLSDSSFDSAARGYDALKRIKGISNAVECAPSSSTLNSAIIDQDASAVAKLIESGVDKNDRARSKRQTLRQAAIAKYREAKEKSKQNNAREKITIINALFTVHDWRRGSIQAHVIQASIGNNCEDCAQFSAEQLQATVGGLAAVEADSIWHCQFVEMEIGGSFTISGQVKHKTAVFNVQKDTVITSEAIISHEEFARLTGQSFECDGIWSSGDTLALDLKKDAAFLANSYIETDKLELSVCENCSLGGTWQIGTVWAIVEGALSTTNQAKIFVEDSATVAGHRFLCSGLWNVGATLDLQLKDSCNFFHSSKLESHTLRLACGQHCTVGGLWIVEVLQLYVRHDLITTSTGKVAVLSEGTATAGFFRSDSTWQSERNLSLICGSMEQSEDGTLFVKDTLDLHIHSFADQICGKIVCNHASFKCLKAVHSDAFIKVNEIDINLPYMDESRFSFGGQMDVLVGALTLKGNSALETIDSRKWHPFPAFVLHGKLNANSIIAPFLAVELGASSVVRLFGAKSFTPEVDFNVLVSCGALTSRKGSTLVSMGDNEVAEGIICASVWSHSGQIRFRTNNIHLITGSLLYKGRLTSVEDKQNHLAELNLVVDDVFVNDGILSAHRLTICGDGEMENRNRIFAVESMDIQLRNFENDEGLIESKNALKLLSASKEWTKIAGTIKSKNAVDLCANKLNFAVKNVHSMAPDKRLSFSAKTELLISTNILDSSKEMSVGCAAKEKVSIDASIDVDRLEILIGSAEHLSDGESSQFVVLPKATVCADTVLITGTSPLVVLVVDGVLKCKRLRVAQDVRSVLIAGRGSLDCSTMHIDGEALCFDLYQTLSATEVVCKHIEVKKNSILRLKTSDEQTTQVTCDRMLVNGTIFVDHRLFISSCKKSSLLKLQGNIIGTSNNSELSVECDSLSIGGQVSNFGFVEVYAKSSVFSNSATLQLLNISNIAFECGELQMKTRIESCQAVKMNGEQVTIEGLVSGCEGANLFVSCGTFSGHLDIHDVEKLEIRSRRQVDMAGLCRRCKIVDIDSKWTKNSARFEECGSVTLKSWCSVNNAFLMAADICITNLGAFINNNVLNAERLRIVSPFVVTVADESDIFAAESEIHSIVTSSNHDLAHTAHADPSSSYLWLDFRRGPETMAIAEEVSASWKDTASMLKDRFKSNTTDVDETVLALKYINDLSHANVHLPHTVPLFADLRKISERFSTQPISLFSVSKFARLISAARTQVTVQKVNNPQQVKRKSGRRKFSGSTLYEGLLQFKSPKYDRDSRNSSETVDIGYVSRSSSEDLDAGSTRASPSHSPSVPIASVFPEHHFELVDQKLDKSGSNGRQTAEQLSESFREIEAAELLEFEELEQELEEELEETEAGGPVRTDFVICREERIGLASLRQKILPSLPHKQRHNNFPLERTPSSSDLVMKRLKVKHTLSSLDLRSFGSETSLCSLDVGQLGDLGSPMQFPKNSFQRSLIPRGSFRRPKFPLPESPLKS